MTRRNVTPFRSSTTQTHKIINGFQLPNWSNGFECVVEAIDLANVENPLNGVTVGAVSQKQYKGWDQFKVMYKEYEPISCLVRAYFNVATQTPGGTPVLLDSQAVMVSGIAIRPYDEDTGVGHGIFRNQGDCAWVAYKRNSYGYVEYNVVFDDYFNRAKHSADSKGIVGGSSPEDKLWCHFFHEAMFRTTDVYSDPLAVRVGLEMDATIKWSSPKVQAQDATVD